MPIIPPKRGYRRGRKKGFTFGAPVPKKPIVVFDLQFERASILANRHNTTAAILRQAIDLGLPILEQRRAAIDAEPVPPMGTNPTDW